MGRERGASVALALAALALASGCAGTEARRLVITEVGKRAVEVTLDEDPGRLLNLGGGFRLTVRTSTGTSSSIGLGTLGSSVRGGGFFMVWSETGYNGPVVAEPFSGGQQGAVPGIKVPSGFFADIDTAPSEVRLSGSRNRASGLLVIFPVFTEDVLDDVVRFGAPEADRPATGGTYASDGTLGNPSGSTSLARRWGAGSPLDTDAESDWRPPQPPSWGVPTP